MSTIGTLKTLNDWAKEIDPDGSTSAVAEVLSQTNVILDELLFKEGNLPTGERTSIRTSLPTPTWRMLNAGVPATKATSAQVDYQCGSLSDRSEIDKDIVTLNGNTAQYRMQEGKAHIEGIGQEFASTMFYGSAASPEEFVGLANYYNDLSANNSDNILDAGGSGSDNMSVYLVGIGEEGIYGVFPKGSKAGIQHEDLGVIDAFDSNNNRFRAYADVYDMKGCVVVKDWRYGVRICNIDVSDLKGKTGTQASTASTYLIDLMLQAIDRIPNINGVKPYFFLNRTAASHLRIQARKESSSVVTIENGVNQFGQNIKQLNVNGVPVGICDALTNSESAVS